MKLLYWVSGTVLSAPLDREAAIAFRPVWKVGVRAWPFYAGSAFHPFLGSRETLLAAYRPHDPATRPDDQAA